MVRAIWKFNENYRNGSNYNVEPPSIAHSMRLDVGFQMQHHSSTERAYYGHRRQMNKLLIGLTARLESLCADHWINQVPINGWLNWWRCPAYDFEVLLKCCIRRPASRRVEWGVDGCCILYMCWFISSGPLFSLNPNFDPINEVFYRIYTFVTHSVIQNFVSPCMPYTMNTRTQNFWGVVSRALNARRSRNISIQMTIKKPIDSSNQDLQLLYWHQIDSSNIWLPPGGRHELMERTNTKLLRTIEITLARLNRF